MKPSILLQLTLLSSFSLISVACSKPTSSLSKGSAIASDGGGPYAQVYYWQRDHPFYSYPVNFVLKNVFKLSDWHVSIKIFPPAGSADTPLYLSFPGLTVNVNEQAERKRMGAPLDVVTLPTLGSDSISNYEAIKAFVQSDQSFYNIRKVDSDYDPLFMNCSTVAYDNLQKLGYKLDLNTSLYLTLDPQDVYDAANRLAGSNLDGVDDAMYRMNKANAAALAGDPAALTTDDFVDTDLSENNALEDEIAAERAYKQRLNDYRVLLLRQNQASADTQTAGADGVKAPTVATPSQRTGDASQTTPTPDAAGASGADDNRIK